MWEEFCDIYSPKAEKKENVYCDECEKLLGKINIKESLKIIKGHVVFYCDCCNKYKVIY